MQLFRNEGVWPHRDGLESLIHYKLQVRDDVFQGQGGVLTGQVFFVFNLEISFKIIYCTLVPFFSKNIIFITNYNIRHGEKWYHARTVVNPPMMQPRSAQMYIHSMNDVAQDFIERMNKLREKDPNGDMPEDFSYELNKWALESICVIGLNKRLGILTRFP